VEAVKLFSGDSSYDPIPLPDSDPIDLTIPSFPNLALFLIDVEAAVQDLTMTKYQELETKYGLNIPAGPPEWAAGIQCTDNGNILNGRPLLTLVPQIAVYEAQSYVRLIHPFHPP
jgi:hypothetical protein